MSFPEDPNAPKPRPMLDCGHIACPHCEAHNNINAVFCTVCCKPIFETMVGTEHSRNHLQEFAVWTEAVTEYERALDSVQELTTPQLIQRKAHSGFGPMVQWLTTLHDIRNL